MLTIRSNAAVPHVDLYPLGAPVFEVGLNALALGAWKTYRLRGRVPSLLAPVGHGGGRQRHVVRNALVIDALRSVLWDRYDWSRIELATGYPYPDCSLVMAAHQVGLRVVVDDGLPDKMPWWSPGCRPLLAVTASTIERIDPTATVLLGGLAFHCRERIAHYKAPRSIDFADS